MWFKTVLPVPWTQWTVPKFYAIRVNLSILRLRDILTTTKLCANNAIKSSLFACNVQNKFLDRCSAKIVEWTAARFKGTRHQTKKPVWRAMPWFPIVWPVFWMPESSNAAHVKMTLTSFRPIKGPAMSAVLELRTAKNAKSTVPRRLRRLFALSVKSIWTELLITLRWEHRHAKYAVQRLLIAWIAFSA